VKQHDNLSHIAKFTGSSPDRKPSYISQIYDLPPTGHFNDRTFVLGEISREAGFDPTPEIASLLYSGYALEESYAAFKFGPHYVKFRTPLDNIRVTTFVSNETEVKVIDPNKLEVIDAVGCRVREVCV